jgi:methyltransferase (TIGR00027 family)
MTAPGPLIRHVSDTALWTAAYRADESERPDALFVDSYARRLAGDRGAEIARRVRQPAVRFGVVLRTAVIDPLIEAAVRDRGFDTVLNLAAGLDARPYRLDLPEDLRWIEADLPELVDYKERILAGETSRCALQRQRLDLSDAQERARLFERVGSGSRRVLVLTEGLLGYLPPEEVASLADALHAQPRFVEWMTDLIGAQVVDRVKNAGDDLKAGNSRVVFAPREGTDFFRPHGWCEAAYHDLFEEGPRLGRDSLMGKAVRLFVRALPAAKRKRFERGLGIAQLERSETPL